MKIMLKTLAIGLATLLAVGCGSSPEPSAGAVHGEYAERIQFPDWVIKRSGAFPGDEGKQVFYGVGSVSGGFPTMHWHARPLETAHAPKFKRRSRPIPHRS